jgi:hypothetical protein
MEAQAWARAQGLPLLGDFSTSPSNIALTLSSPQNNTTYRIDPNFDLSSQGLSVEAVSGYRFSKITLYVDGAPFAELSSPPYQGWWILSEGAHRFWAEGFTSNGEKVRSEEVVIEVIK